MRFLASRYFFPGLGIFRSSLPDDVDAHRAGRSGDAVHRCFHRAGGHVRHLRLRDLLELLAGELTDLLLPRLVRPGPLLLLGVQPERLLDEDGGGRRLHDEGEGAVRVDGDEDRDDEAFLRLRLGGGVELLAEAHDVDAVLAERRPDRRRRVRLAGGKLELDESGDLLRHPSLLRWSQRPERALLPHAPRVRAPPVAGNAGSSCSQVFSTCMKSSSTGVARPKMETSTRTRPLSGFTSSTVPLKLGSGPSPTRRLSPSPNSPLGFGFSAPSESWVVRRAISCSLTAGGLVVLTTNPVIFGVFFTRCQVRSLSSIWTRM